MRRVELCLIQPCSSWGRHIYLPNGLLSVQARCRAVGVTTCLIDENLGQRVDQREYSELVRGADMIGIGVLGPPYIPEAIRVAAEVRRLGCTQPIAFGGEVVMRLSVDQFAQIFKDLGDVRQMRSESGLDDLLGITTPSMYNVSAGPVVRDMPDAMRSAYFRKEWCLFTSQGCAFNCNFCAATKGMKERFRDPDAFADEVYQLMLAAREAAGERPPYEVYCSSLDGCQTPTEMERALLTVAEISASVGVRANLRFLATAAMTSRAVRRDPRVLHRWKRYGLACIGLGVDGNDPVVWRRENKRHNTPSVISEAIGCIEDAGIQPEALMVIGFPGDNMRAILLASYACFRLAKQGIRPRPYVGKAHSPGSKGWTDGGKAVDMMVADPRLFREMEYAGLGSSVTHADPLQRWVSGAMFLGTTMVLKTFARTGCPTYPLFPTESVPRPLAMVGRAWNSLMPIDR